MSSAKSPPKKEPLQSTRQMLDELDALMDRMLAIPVNELEEPDPTTRAVTHVPTVSATLTVLEVPAETDNALGRGQPPSPWASLAAADITPEPAHEDQRLPHLVDPALLTSSALAPSEMEESATPDEVLPTSLTLLPVHDETDVHDLEPMQRPRRSLASRILLPLVCFNACFDICTYLLGGLGRWLRDPRGRHLLGLTGLGLLAAAGLWLAKDWLGWTW